MIIFRVIKQPAFQLPPLQAAVLLQLEALRLTDRFTTLLEYIPLQFTDYIKFSVIY